MLPTSAVEHYARQQRITAAAVVAVRRERRPAQQAVTLAAFQLLAAREAVTAVPQMLEEQGITAPADATVVAASVAGVASDGRPLDTLVGLSQTFGQAWLDFVVATQVQDAARTAAGLEIAARPRVQGWIRMMNPPSCARCAVLAGKWFKWNQGFQRHPRCDCRHIPAQEADYSDHRLSGDKWFHTIPTGEQDRIFTKAGAQAIRDGADLGQVVNARRGMQPAQLFGRDVSITREGITKRGLYGSSQAGARDGFNSRSTGQRGTVKNYTVRTAKRARIMPETIYRVAEDRADAQRLLKLYGYITP